MSWGSSQLARPTRAVLRVHSAEVVVNFEEAAQSLSSTFLEGTEVSNHVELRHVESCRVESCRVLCGFDRCRYSPRDYQGQFECRQ